MNTTINKRLIVVSGVVLLCLVVLAGCATTETSNQVPPVEPDALRVGVSTKSAPLVFKRNDEIVGLEADLARALAEYLGKSCQFVELNWKDQIPALKSKKTDIIMSGMSITPGRRLRVAFSDPYVKSGLSALVHTRNLERFENILNRRNEFFKIGVVKGTTGELFVRDTFTNSRIVTFSTSQNALNDLIFGTINMLVHDMPMLYALLAQNESRGLMVLPTLFTEEYLAWGIRHDDPELLEDANSFLRSIRSDGKLESHINRWLPLFEVE
jgi:polar amino acid transport system substrate-binding protein